MSYITRAATVGMVGFDTSERLTPAMVAELEGLGMKFAMRYVAQSYQDPSVGMSPAELASILAANIAVGLVQFARTSGWSATSGAADGTAAAKNALALGVPKTTLLACDLEGAIPSSSVAIDYVNNWAQAAVKAGMSASALILYVGPGIPLTGTELYEKLQIAKYWRSGSIVPEPDPRGYEMIQLYPGNLTVAPGVVIDRDVVQEDFFGDLPSFCVLG